MAIAAAREGRDQNKVRSALELLHSKVLHTSRSIVYFQRCGTTHSAPFLATVSRTQWGLSVSRRTRLPRRSPSEKHVLPPLRFSTGVASSLFPSKAFVPFEKYMLDAMATPTALSSRLCTGSCGCSLLASSPCLWNNREDIHSRATLLCEQTGRTSRTLFLWR